MPFLKNKLAMTAVISVAMMVIMIVLSSSNALKGWQLFFADSLYQGKNPGDQIVIVHVDQKTIDPDGLGEYGTWNRSNFARVLKNINKHEPKLVAFDFFFRAAKDDAGDGEFRDALSQTKNPVIMYPGNPSEYDEQKGYYINPKDQKEVILPLELFRNLENIRLGLGNVIKDEDSAVRRFMPIIYDEKLQHYDENLAFAVARRILDGEGLPEKPIMESNNYVIRLENKKEIKIPLEAGQMLINFSSRLPEKPFKSISFLDVYNENYQQFGNDPQGLFKDKIVLIGPKANFFNDLYVTPVSRETWMPGIELQANALQTILEQKFLRNLTFPEKAAIIIFLALASAFVFMFTKIRYSLICLFGVPLAYTLAAQPAFNAGVILDLVHPYLTVVAVFMAVYLYRYVTEFREKMALQGAFAKYVNPALAKQIAEHPETLKLGGESRDITVMFTDIAHSTTIEENLKPQSVVALLSEYFEAMSKVIMEEGGTVDKFEGDGIMALFGAPVAQPDHAVRAARAALKMRVRLAQLLEKWKTDPPLPGGEPKPQIDFRCGLSSGEAIVGNMGSTERFDYTALGDVVNLGSRLEGANKIFGTHIMMNKETYEKAKNYFEVRKLGKVKVVGKNEAVEVYEPVAPKGELEEKDQQMFRQYTEALDLYYSKKFAEALTKFEEILKVFPGDEISKIYRQRCEVLRDYPPKPDWDGSFELGSK